MKQSNNVSSRLWLPRWFGRLDRFDLWILLLLVTIYICVAMLPFAPSKFGDLNFQMEAKGLALALQGAGSWFDVAIVKAPAPTLYYTIPYLTVPPGSEDHVYWRAAFMWTIGWMVFSILLTRRTGEMIGGAFAGKLAAILTLLSPFEVYYSYGLNAETPAFIGVTMFTYGWARWQKEGLAPSLFKEGAWVAWIGLSLFILSRPNASLLFP